MKLKVVDYTETHTPSTELSALKYTFSDGSSVTYDFNKRWTRVYRSKDGRDLKHSNRAIKMREAMAEFGRSLDAAKECE